MPPGHSVYSQRCKNPQALSPCPHSRSMSRSRLQGGVLPRKGSADHQVRVTRFPGPSQWLFFNGPWAKRKSACPTLADTRPPLSCHLKYLAAAHLNMPLCVFILSSDNCESLKPSESYFSRVEYSRVYSGAVTTPSYKSLLGFLHTPALGCRFIRIPARFGYHIVHSSGIQSPTR